MIEVILPGLFSTIQDEGRKGYRTYGVPSSGALDPLSFRAANALVGNKLNEACIEIIGGMFRFKALEDIVIAVTGGEAPVRVKGKVEKGWRPIFVEKGSIVDIMAPLRGFIIYLAVAGGISSDFVMGSYSTYTKAKFGGLKGEKVKKGDVLNLKAKVNAKEAWERVKDFEFPVNKRPSLPSPKDETSVRVTLGTHVDLFPKSSIKTFFSEPYEVTPESDRMGYRLKGTPITYPGGGRVTSFPLIEGFVQVPHDGQPIVLLADAQTVGGYPVIASVIPPDIPLVAHSRPGSRLRFTEVNRDEAEEEARKWFENLNSIAEL